MTWMVNVVNYSNIAINPILYGLLNKTIRAELRSKFRGFFSTVTWTRRSSETSSSSRSENNAGSARLSSSGNDASEIHKPAALFVTEDTDTEDADTLTTLVVNHTADYGNSSDVVFISNHTAEEFLEDTTL